MGNKNVLFLMGLDPLTKRGIPNNIMEISRVLINKGLDVQIASPALVPNVEVDKIKLIKLSTYADIKCCIKSADFVIPMSGFSASSSKPLYLSVAKACEDLNKDFFPIFHTTDKVFAFSESFGVNSFLAQLNKHLIVETLKQPTCKKVICVSNAVKNCLIKLGIPKRKLVVVYNGVDFSNPIFEEVVTETYDLIFVGRLSVEKNPTMFINIVNILEKENPKIKACMVGNGPELASVNNMINGLGLKANIDIFQDLNNYQTLKLVKSSRVLVSTSYTESFGMAILEALSLGVFVVAPNIEGPKELLSSYEGSRRFEPQNINNALSLIKEGLQIPKPKTNIQKKFGIIAQTNNLLKVLLN